MRYFTLLLFISHISISTFAQNTNDPVSDSLSIDEVVVTHSRVPLNSRHTPKPIQIITSKILEMSAGKDLSQVLNEQVGIDVVGSLSNAGKDKSIFVRGASGEYTVVLVDGIPVIDPSGLGGVTDIRSFSLSSIERIEVLKGSQSALYGSDAIAGVINIITKDPKSTGQGHSLGLSYGSFGTLFANAATSGKTNNISYNLNVSREQSNGISEALSADKNVEFNKDGSDMTSVRGMMNVALSNTWSLRPFLSYSDYNSDTDAGSFSDTDNKYKNQLFNTGAALSYKNEAWSGQLSYSLSKTDRSFDSSFGLSEFFGRFQNIDAWVNHEFNQDVQLTGGMNIQVHKMLDESTTIPDPSIRIISPYVSMLLSPSDELNAEIGLRYNNHSKFGSNTNISTAVSYWVADEVKLFSSYATGFKAPNLFQLYGAFGANEDLQPQLSQSFEIGASLPYISRIVQPQITYFKRKVDDVVAYDFSIGYFNSGTQDDQGLEVELAVKLNDEFTIRGSYTYLSGDLTTNNNGSENIINNLYRRPKNQYNVALYYSKNKLSINGSVKSIGERTDLFFNPDNFFSAEDVTLESYVYASLYAQYDIAPNVMAFIDLKNIGDAQFQEIYGFSTAGRNMMLGFKVQL